MEESLKHWLRFIYHGLKFFYEISQHEDSDFMIKIIKQEKGKMFVSIDASKQIFYVPHTFFCLYNFKSWLLSPVTITSALGNIYYSIIS